MEAVDWDFWGKSSGSNTSEDWDDFGREDIDRDDDEQMAPADAHNPRRLEDAHIAETVAKRVLSGRYCWARGLDWMHYSRGRWAETSEAHVAERVRRDLIDQHAREARAGAESERLRALSGLLSAHRIRAIVTLARGILATDAAEFDQHPDLLNVNNGVVDLTSGKLIPHSPGFLLTKKTSVDYVPGATSADWVAALLALPESVAAWMQVRVGQAATGHATPDDIMPVLQGGGSNGKTTITGTITRALGSHAITVPERVLMANPSDHPTELMTLRGARLAIIEETPEARHLSVKRLKDTVGTPTMTARYIGRNNVTWDATHSLFLTTNYMPRVDETDHGTWRRLALVRFPYTFTAPDEPSTSVHARQGVEGLRERLREGRHGQHEAVLAWVVDGARRWYDHDRLMPPAPSVVKQDTTAWRAEADLICAYILDRLIFDQEAHVVTTEMYADFSEWVAARGHKTWADPTLSARFAGHGMVEAAKVEKRRTRECPGLSRSRASFVAPPAQYTAWYGVRFRTDADTDPVDTADSTEVADLPKRALVQGVQGVSAASRENPRISTTEVPLHTLHTDHEQSNLDTIRGPLCSTCNAYPKLTGHSADCTESKAS